MRSRAPRRSARARDLLGTAAPAPARVWVSDGCHQVRASRCPWGRLWEPETNSKYWGLGRRAGSSFRELQCNLTDAWVYITRTHTWLPGTSHCSPGPANEQVCWFVSAAHTGGVTNTDVLWSSSRGWNRASRGRFLLRPVGENLFCASHSPFACSWEILGCQHVETSP